MSKERSKRELPTVQEHIDKLKKVVEEGNYYGALEMYKSISARYVTAQRFSEALDILYSGACIELEHGLASSGDSNKIVGVFYKANEYATKNPNFLDYVENALGIREWIESQGHQYIVTDDKEGPDCELEKHIPDLHVRISTPFHPAYVTAERIKKAKNHRLLLTADIGSDHIDLQEAAAAGLTVAEVTGSNLVSVAEDELIRILILMRNFVPGYNQVVNGEWNVAGIAFSMIPHISGTTNDTQQRYAARTKNMLERYFKVEDFPAQNYIVKDGELAPQYR